MTVQTTDPGVARSHCASVRPARESSRSRPRTVEPPRRCWASAPPGRRRRTSASSASASGRHASSTAAPGGELRLRRPVDRRGSRRSSAASCRRPDFGARDDATYFPMPWMLSSRGYGVLVDNDETAYHDLATRRGPTRWSIEVVGAPEGMTPRPAPATLRFRVFAGPRRRTCCGASRPRSAASRRPPRRGCSALVPAGGSRDVAGAAPRRATCPVSVVADVPPLSAVRRQIRARRAGAHRRGARARLRGHDLLQPHDLHELRARVRRRGGGGRARATTSGGTPYIYQYFTVALLRRRPVRLQRARRDGAPTQRCSREAIDDGHDGWMEDFGEYTPLDARTADGRDGGATHNRYPTDYHCAAYDFARRQRRPIVRFQRSGWTGAARCAQVVWGGDPDDGLGLRRAARRSVTARARHGPLRRRALGLRHRRLLLAAGRPRSPTSCCMRWVQLGAVSGVMRTERDGFAHPGVRRGRRSRMPARSPTGGATRSSARSSTRTSRPRIASTGAPACRSCATSCSRIPTMPAAVAREDEFLFGPDLLVAPVLDARRRPRARCICPAGDVDRLLARGRVRLGRRRASSCAARDVVAGRRSVDRAGAARRAAAASSAPARCCRCCRPTSIRSPTTARARRASCGCADRARRAPPARLPARHLGGTLRNTGALSLRRGAGDVDASSCAPSARSTVMLEASMHTLQAPFEPCTVLVNRRPLPDDAWSFDPSTGVLRTIIDGRGARVEVTACTS